MEKNRKILDAALRNLPSFTPKDGTWEDLSSALQPDVFEISLRQLKSFDPPENLWDSISQDLSKEEKISQLKQFTPDEAIWENIDLGLKKSEARQFRMKIYRFVKLASAAAALIFISYFLFYPAQNKTSISYSEELIEIENTNFWQDDDAEIMMVLQQLCASNPMACNAPEFREKEKELAFLNEKKTEILKQMNPYDENKNLQVLLTRIELEKTEVVKQMISKIL